MNSTSAVDTSIHAVLPESIVISVCREAVPATMTAPCFGRVSRR
jgi:hypothetical protein